MNLRVSISERRLFYLKRTLDCTTTL